MNFYETVSEVLRQYGESILLDSRRFCSILNDMVPQAKELKVIKRMGDSGILEEVFKVLNMDRKASLTKINILLSEEGFSDDWKAIAFSAFGYEKSSELSIIEGSSVLSSTATIKTNGSELIETAQGNLLFVTDSTIEKNAFAGRNDIRIVVLGDGVKVIKKDAFKGCHKLEYLYLSDTIKSFAAGAFADCDNLTFIYEKNQDRWSRNIVIDEKAFEGCHIRIVVGSSEKIKWHFRNTDVLSESNVYKAVERRVGAYGGKFFEDTTRIVFDTLEKYA